MSLETNPTPTYINITDSTFKSIATLPSPSGPLSSIIVLSTTLKNRYLLQFANPVLLRDWSAAFRLALFEYTSLQEAYTGALLSAKGAKLNGIRTLLTETKFQHEDWVSVRFGAGMPWKKCWTVITPPTMKKKKKQPPPGTIAFYEDKKTTKKPPLATISGSYATYAVYPQNSVLIDASTLIKVEGKVEFNDVEGEKDAAVFLMPEPHPGVPGFETLIRFLVPVLDVFKLYGRPQRLNANKADTRSLLFALPSLPYTQYLELAEAQELVSKPGSENWSAFEWTRNIKMRLDEKLKNEGYKGCGMIVQRSKTVAGASLSATKRSSLGGVRNRIRIAAKVQEKNRSSSAPVTGQGMMTFGSSPLNPLHNRSSYASNHSNSYANSRNSYSTVNSHSNQHPTGTIPSRLLEKEETLSSPATNPYQQAQGRDGDYVGGGTGNSSQNSNINGSSRSTLDALRHPSVENSHANNSKSPTDFSPSSRSSSFYTDNVDPNASSASLSPAPVAPATAFGPIANAPTTTSSSSTPMNHANLSSSPNPYFSESDALNRTRAITNNPVTGSTTCFYDSAEGPPSSATSSPGLEMEQAKGKAEDEQGYNTKQCVDGHAKQQQLYNNNNNQEYSTNVPASITSRKSMGSNHHNIGAHRAPLSSSVVSPVDPAAVPSSSAVVSPDVPTTNQQYSSMLF